MVTVHNIFCKKAATAALLPAFSRNFFSPHPLLKYQNSRSEPPLSAASKILTNIFRTANKVTHLKAKNHRNADFASSALAIVFLRFNSSSLSEQDFPRSGRVSGQIKTV
ncbi:hypothetical protein RJO36_004052 [Enterobacter hormaechei]|nr:hypothetical protein [Enterobacter hormaechei]